MELTSLFFAVLMMCETPNCKCNDEHYCYCTHDDGKGLGAYAIHECVIIDVNRVFGTNYDHTDAYHIQTAEEIMRLYLGHYVCERRLGRKPTWEDAARVHNGGPNGFKKACTMKYLRKFRDLLFKNAQVVD